MTGAIASAVIVASILMLGCVWTHDSHKRLAEGLFMGALTAVTIGVVLLDIVLALHALD